MDALATQIFDDVLGLGRESDNLTVPQTVLRTVAVYVFAVLAVRLGSRRFLGKASAFDVVVAITIGSILSRAVDGSSPFLIALVSVAALVGMHGLLAALANRLRWFGPLVKGSPVLLVRDGQVDLRGMRRSGVSQGDLEEALRLQARDTDLSRVRAAYLERNGSISVLPGAPEPKVLEVKVEDGVQTVRLRLE